MTTEREPVEALKPTTATAQEQPPSLAERVYQEVLNVSNLKEGRGKDRDLLDDLPIRVFLRDLAVSKLEVVGPLDLKAIAVRGCSSDDPFRYAYVAGLLAVSIDGTDF